MANLPHVLYLGPDADAVESEWDDDVTFALTGGDPDAAASAYAAAAPVEAVVYRHVDGSLGEAVEGVRAAAGDVPLIVLGALDGTVETDTMAGITHAVAISDDADVVETLSTIAPLVTDAAERNRERSMLDSLLESVPLSIYFKDSDHRHVRVSDAMPTMIGPDYIENQEGKRHHTPADIQGKTDWDLYSGDLAESAIADDRDVMETGEPIEGRVEHSYGEKGTGTYVQTTKAPWYRDGEVVGVLGVTADVSERKTYEYQLEQQNERLERFATRVSHDIRNPLSVAVGRLEHARETGADEHFDAIERSLSRIESLVDDLLTVTRHGESVLDPEPITLPDLAAKAWSTVDTGNATLETTTTATLLAEPGRTRSLLENLFRNAVEHGPDDEDDAITVTIGDLPDAEGFFVADDGVGIPPEHRDSVVDPGFSSADDAEIGLGIVTAIANAHSWEMTVTESADGGARFEFRGVRRPAPGT